MDSLPQPPLIPTSTRPNFIATSHLLNRRRTVSEHWSLGPPNAPAHTGARRVGHGRPRWRVAVAGRARSLESVTTPQYTAVPPGESEYQRWPAASDQQTPAVPHHAMRTSASQRGRSGTLDERVVSGSGAGWQDYFWMAHRSARRAGWGHPRGGFLSPAGGDCDALGEGRESAGAPAVLALTDVVARAAAAAV